MKKKFLKQDKIFKKKKKVTLHVARRHARTLSNNSKQYKQYGETNAVLKQNRATKGALQLIRK